MGKFFEGLFQGGLIAVHEMLGTAEALDAVEIVIEGNGGGDVVFEGHILVVFQYFCQAADLDAGKGNLVVKFALDILVQALHFRFCKILGIEAMAEGIGVAVLAAAIMLGGWEVGRGRHGFLSVQSNSLIVL